MFVTSEEKPDESPLQCILNAIYLSKKLDERLEAEGFINKEEVEDAAAGEK